MCHRARMHCCCVAVCRQNFDTAMAQQRAEIERLNNSISTLRQERDRVIMVGVHAGPRHTLVTPGHLTSLCYAT